MKKKRRLTGTPKTSKPRERSPQSGDEIVSARDRFKGALQDLLPQSDDDSDISDDELWPNKNKRLSVHKKRNITDKQNDQDGNKYIMKLFDRTIDLAQFNESTPLYPICRAWIANQPHQIYNIMPLVHLPSFVEYQEKRFDIEKFCKKESGSDGKEEAHYEMPKDNSDFDAVKDIHKLPPPEPLKKQSPSTRIPQVIPYKSTFNAFMKEGEEPPSKDDLLQDNLQHWSKVRKSWMEASSFYEARYEKSIRLLTAMYNKAQRMFQN